MYQFTNDQLLLLKRNIERFMEREDSYLDLISIYHTSYDVLLFLFSQEEENTDQINFWSDALEYAIRKMFEFKDEIDALIDEARHSEYSVSYAGYIRCKMYPDEVADSLHNRLLEEREYRCEYYYHLRKLAGIYLDIFSEDVESEEYLYYLYFYNSISAVIDAPERGFDENDRDHLSLAEIDMILAKLEKARLLELDSPCPYGHNSISEQIYYFTILKAERMDALEPETDDEEPSE